MPTLYLMVGYPGSGKTTTAQVICQLTGAEHIWADRERRRLFGEVYRTEDSDRLYEILNQQTAQLLKAGKNVIFDTNFNYYSDRQKLREIAERAGVDTKVLWLTLPKELAYRRAVTKTNGKRMFIDMTHEDFECVAAHLEEPRDDERPVKLDGTKITPEYIKEKLGL